MRRELMELKSYLCELLCKDNLPNYEVQEYKRLLQGIDVILLDKREDRHNDLYIQDYFNGLTLQTKVLFKSKRELYIKTLIKLINNVLSSKEVIE